MGQRQKRREHRHYKLIAHLGEGQFVQKSQLKGKLDGFGTQTDNDSAGEGYLYSNSDIRRLKKTYGINAAWRVGFPALDG